VLCALLVAIALPSPARAEEPPVNIDVRGSRHPKAASRDDSVSSESIPRERLQAPGLSAADALRASPGVTITELGGLGASASIGVRGATSAQTPVYLGSVRINDEVAGSADLATLPLWFIERVELYRGNAPGDADRAAPGGSVHFVPRRPDGKLGLGALVGSYGTRGAWATASSGTPGNGVIGGVGFEAADNDYAFDDSRGTAFLASDDRGARLSNADAALFGAWLHARRQLGRAELGLLAHHGSLERGVARIANVPATLARESLQRRLLALSARTRLGPDGSWFEAQTSLLASSNRVTDPARELSLGSSNLRVSGVRGAQSLALRFAPTRQLWLRPAVDSGIERLTREEDVLASRDQRPALEAARFDLRPSLAGELGDDVWSFRGVAAFECTSASETRLAACSEHPFTGRFGPSLRTGKLVAFANVARSARSPTLGERFGMSPVVRGNPRLDSERAVGVDAGVRLHDAAGIGLWLGASGFVRWTSELIVFSRTAQGYVVPENRERARVLGTELDLGAEPLPGLRLDAALTLTDARDTSPTRSTVNDVLPFQPRLVFSPGIAYASSLDFESVHRIALYARYVHQASRYADRAGLAVIPAQGNLELGGEAALLHALVARLRVDNALDQNRFDVVGFPLPGTSLFASLEARL
jgi:vitamin B12 transporter